MKQLLEFLVKGMAGTEDFDIEETDAGGRTEFVIHANPDFVGRIIGKGGKTIKAIRNLLKVKATLEKKAVGVSVIEKS
jgi:predicted RNA-binding protein YlqC (UPF0109 family)